MEEAADHPTCDIDITRECTEHGTKAVTAGRNTCEARLNIPVSQDQGYYKKYPVGHSNR